MTSPRNRSSAPSRLRAQHRKITTCCCCRCILHLQQYSRRLNLFFFCIYLVNSCKYRVSRLPHVILYVFFWVFPRRPIVVCRRFGTLYQFHLQGLDVKYEVPKRIHTRLKTRRKFEIKITSR